MMDYPPRREFTRIPIQLKAEVRTQNRCFTSTGAHTLSMKGMLVQTTETLMPGEEAEITIQLPGAEIFIQVSGVVVSQQAQGIAFQFSRIHGPESYEHLKKLVLYNAPDTDQVENEFESHIGLKKKE